MFWTAILIILSTYFSIAFFRRFSDLIGRAVLPYLAIAIRPEDIPKELNDTFAKHITEGSVAVGFNFMMLIGCLYFLKRSLGL